MNIWHLTFVNIFNVAYILKYKDVSFNSENKFPVVYKVDLFWFPQVLFTF